MPPPPLAAGLPWWFPNRRLLPKLCDGGVPHPQPKPSALTNKARPGPPIGRVAWVEPGRKSPASQLACRREPNHSLFLFNVPRFGLEGFGKPQSWEGLGEKRLVHRSFSKTGRRGLRSEPQLGLVQAMVGDFGNNHHGMMGLESKRKRENCLPQRGEWLDEMPHQRLTCLETTSKQTAELVSPPAAIIRPSALC